MIDQLPWKKEPAWLTSLTAESIEHGPFPLRSILRNSLFYPSAGFDGDPVKYLAGHIPSFVYVDYGYGEEAFDRALQVPGFLGYQVLGRRSVTENELIPHGWSPEHLPPCDRTPADWQDGNAKPFCIWVVMERRADVSDEHGPSRFSLLYWCHEGVAAFQSLYLARKLSPKAVAIIQPGYGFGGNWTDFTDPNEILARTIQSNLAGQPKLLLFGGYFDWHDYQEPCWPSYTKWLGFLEKAGGGYIGVWK